MAFVSCRSAKGGFAEYHGGSGVCSDTGQTACECCIWSDRCADYCHVFCSSTGTRCLAQLDAIERAVTCPITTIEYWSRMAACRDAQDVFRCVARTADRPVRDIV